MKLKENLKEEIQMKLVDSPQSYVILSSRKLLKGLTVGHQKRLSYALGLQLFQYSFQPTKFLVLFVYPV